MEYLIGLDIGTSSVKGVLMTTSGRIALTAREPFSYMTGKDGRVELEPEAYLSVCFRALRTLASAAKHGTVKAVSASSASGNLILFDEKNEPLTNVISWQDKRVTTEAKELLADLDPAAFYREIGWPYGFKAMPLSQLCYLKKHDPELLSECRTAAMSTEYLFYKLTGRWGISPSAGVTYYLIDQEKGVYDRALLDRLGLCEEKFPPVMPCGSVLGTILPEMSAKCGLDAGTPVVLGSFDHPSAARGAGVLHEGEMLLSLGTSWVAFFPVKDRETALKTGGLADPFLSPRGAYGAMTSVASLSGRILSYAKRFIDDSDGVLRLMSSLAKKSVPGANGLCINLIDETPDEIIGTYPKEDIARAVMEGAVRLLKERLDRFAALGVSAETAVMVGGPSEDPFLARLIEEMTGLAVRVVHGAYAGAVGAAVIAGVGAGIYQDEEDAAKRFHDAAEREKERRGA